jgi:hypothetical protein
MVFLDNEGKQIKLWLEALKNRSVNMIKFSLKKSR